jgi:succinylarginine dihydrolase
VKTRAAKDKQMPLVEINFDGLIGPTHNYAGLSPGNIASTRNAGRTSQPRAAALQGLAKMRANVALGLVQGILLPLDRPNAKWLSRLGTDAATAEAHLLAQAWSASSMWAANAATVSPAFDTADGRTHLTVANLLTMPHRSHEWPDTLTQLRTIFSDPSFVVHGPVPPPFGDEGAANHMRLCSNHGSPGIEVFVHGENGGAFPARQHIEASKAVARIHRLDPERTLFVQQSEEAIAAGAFHNDVVAVANERVLFAHEQAFADKRRVYADLRRLMPEIEIVEVPASEVSLADAISSYLFNSQLVTLPDGGGMALILPTEARDTASVWSWLERHIATQGAIRQVIPVDVRESMANGGGPACLRLRVVCDTVKVNPRFLLDDARITRLEGLVAAFWPETIHPEELGSAELRSLVDQAYRALHTMFELL